MNASTITNGDGPTRVIGRELYELQGNGPVSYVNGVGDPILYNPTKFLSTVPGGFLTVSGNYELKSQPSITNNLRPSWLFRWFVVSTGAEVANGINLSGEFVQFFAMGGEM